MLKLKELMIIKNLLTKSPDKLVGLDKLFSNSSLSSEPSNQELKLLTTELLPLNKPSLITKLELMPELLNATKCKVSGRTILTTSLLNSLPPLKLTISELTNMLDSPDMVYDLVLYDMI
jgi:hypothetical protein